MLAHGGKGHVCARSGCARRVLRRAGVWRMTSLRIAFDWSFGQPTPEKTPSGNTYNYGLDINHPLFRRLDPLTRGR